jgi:hypothetical protein
MKNRMLACLSALAAVGIVAACSDSTDPVVTDNTVAFTAALTAGAEVPTPTGNPTGSGTFTAVLDTVTNVMTYDVTYTGLTSNVSAGHIHGPALAGATANPILTFSNTGGQSFTTGATSGVAHGTWLLTSATSFVTNINGDSLRKLLFAGQAYVNIHTATNGSGEIRGQIALKP